MSNKSIKLPCRKKKLKFKCFITADKQQKSTQMSHQTKSPLKLKPQQPKQLHNMLHTHQLPQIQPQQQQKFNAQSIISQLSNQQDITIKHLHAQMKEFQLAYKQTARQVVRLRRQVQLRPTLHSLTENTIGVTSAVHIDPNVLKLLHSKDDREKKYKEVDGEDEVFDPVKQLKESYEKLGKKLCQVNDGLPLLLGLIRTQEKQYSSQMSQLKSLVQEKTHSLQDQLNQLKMQEITQRLTLTEKLESQNQILQEKQRLLETKQTWQIKDLRTKLHEKLSKQVFDTNVQEIIEENKKVIRKFQQETTSLVNPQKIREIEEVLQTNREVLTKQMVECHMKIDGVHGRIEKELVNVEFYKKERTSLEKRIANVNLNFQELYEKVNSLKTSSDDYSGRIKTLERQNSDKTHSMQEMKTILRSLSITEEFQKMLSKINPEKILQLQVKIENVEGECKEFYRMFNQVSQQIDSIYNKFEVSGVLVPNKSRQKQHHLEDLKQIIDEYFVENQFARKISRLESELNDGKASVEAIRLLEKKISRLQKESQYSHIIQEFNRLEEQIKKDLRIFEQKMQTGLSKNQVNKSYFEGLVLNMSGRKSYKEHENVQIRRKSLATESSNKIVQNHNEKGNKQSRVLSYRTNSLRKINPWQTTTNKDKQMNSSFYKNTISSSRKNLLKSGHLLMEN